MKSAVVFRVGDRIIVVVSEQNKKLAERSFASQVKAVDWLEEEHFDIQSLRIQCQKN